MFYPDIIYWHGCVTTHYLADIKTRDRCSNSIARPSFRIFVKKGGWVWPNHFGAHIFWQGILRLNPDKYIGRIGTQLKSPRFLAALHFLCIIVTTPCTICKILDLGNNIIIYSVCTTASHSYSYIMLSEINVMYLIPKCVIWMVTQGSGGKGECPLP